MIEIAKMSRELYAFQMRNNGDFYGKVVTGDWRGILQANPWFEGIWICPSMATVGVGDRRGCTARVVWVANPDEP